MGRNRRWLLLGLLGLVTAGLVAFLGLNFGGQPTKLQILHASDFEAGVPALEDAVGFSAVLNALKAEYPDQTLVLSSGDNYIMGPFFDGSADPALDKVLGKAGSGHSDITVLNALGIQAAALGNHEFDQGTGKVADLITSDEAYAGANFPYLSANLDFSNDINLKAAIAPEGQEAKTIPHKIAKSAVITVNGTKVGLVGATTPTLPRISSPGPNVIVNPWDSENWQAIAESIQPAVDALTAQGINKIILLSHMQQLMIEQELASRLTDVDVIIAGGSHEVLADNTDRLRVGDQPTGPYPILKTSAKGEPVAVLNTGSNYRYVGRLVVDFDRQGRLIPNSIDPQLSGAYATDSAGVAATGSQLADPKILEVTAALQEIVATKDGNLFGSASVFLNGNRQDVRTQETNLGDLTADANLSAARKVDPTVMISIKNGGGIRDSIGSVNNAGGNNPNAGERTPTQANPLVNKKAGQISQLDIENCLRFNNGLTLLTLNAFDLRTVIEHGVSATMPGKTPGQFPQVSGISFSFDPNGIPGNRVRSLAVMNSAGKVIDTIIKDGQIVGDRGRIFRIVTLNYLADGGDKYPFLDIIERNPQRAKRVDLLPKDLKADFNTPGAEQKILADYLAENYSRKPYNVAELPPEQDQRIQDLSKRKDTVFSS